MSTVMSRMHQRSEGYPFGSLVDFVSDAMGRECLMINIQLFINSY